MATKRRKQRLERKVNRAFDKGNDSNLVFAKRLRGIEKREWNRANDNTKIDRAGRFVADTLRNAAGLPARSLTGNVSNAIPKAEIKLDANGQIIPTGSIQSPESQLVEYRNKIVYGSTGKPTPTNNNSQNMDLLEANLSPAMVSSGNNSGIADTSKPATSGIVDESALTQTDFTQEEELPIENLTGASSERVASSAFTAPASGSVFGGNAPASTGGVQLGPDGQPMLGGDNFYTMTPEQRAEEEARKKEQDYYKKEARKKVDREAIMQNALRQFQGEIDAVNSVYADKIGQAKLEGADRLGSDRAANFNAGAVNSTFGEASKERVLEFNRGREGAIQNEKLNLISQINSAARALGDKFYAEKKAAKEAGLESYMSSLLSSKEAKTAIAKEVATNILSANLTPANMTEKQLKEIAKNAGVSVELIKNSFTTVKTEMEVAQAEADRKAKIDGQFTLGKDQVRYDAYGNVVGRGVSGESSTTKTYTNPDGRTITLTSAQKTRVNQIDTVAKSLDSFRTLYDSLAGKRGGQLTGEDAGTLAGAYNALIFQIAQAAGTGALQAADREIVESMIPNPTTIGGAFKGLIRGGHQGGLNAIDEAKKVFINAREAILSDTDDTTNTVSTNTVTAPDGTLIEIID